MHFVRQILIDAPPARVWALLDDETNIPKWMPFIIDTHFPDGKPEGDPVGARFVQVMEERGKRSGYAGIITAYEKGRLLGVRLTPEAFTVDARYYIAPQPGAAGTELTYTSMVTPVSWYGRIMLMLGKRMLARIADQQLARLRIVAEGGDPP